MIPPPKRTLAAIFTCLAIPLNLNAHHIAEEDVDIDNPITLRGRITGIDWFNPHVLLHLEVIDDENNVQSWILEAGPPRELLEVGISRAQLTEITALNAATITVVQSNDKSCLIACRGHALTMTLSNGQRLVINSGAFSLATSLSL